MLAVFLPKNGQTPINSESIICEVLLATSHSAIYPYRGPRTRLYMPTHSHQKNDTHTHT